MTRRAHLPLPEPRGLNREQAANYISVSPTKFDEMVDDGRMPKPKMVDSRRIWDRHGLDVAFDALPSVEAPKAEWR
jgi:hypothetical protein